VELPYSKKEFSVPANVDIYGTMNTADRSVEALDTALRRRFTFEEMMPDPSLIEKELGGKNEWNGFKISDVLRTINKRIEVLVDSDHLIGHAYFLTLSQSANFEKELRSIFTDKIIPLLQEYFYNNYVKIGMVLGSGFISVQRSQDEDFAEIEDSLAADYSDRKLYRIIPAKEVNLKEAIAELMKTKRHDTIQQ
jgi:5-methylcytosine-specific restriction endonuclease McrBC GTP-binding regulatory subunit McrB